MFGWLTKFWKKKPKVQSEPFFPITIAYGRDGFIRKLRLETGPCQIQGDYMAFVQHLHDPETLNDGLSLADRVLYWLILNEWERQRILMGQGLARVETSVDLPRFAARMPRFCYAPRSPSDQAERLDIEEGIKAFDRLHEEIKRRMAEVDRLLQPPQDELTTEDFVEILLAQESVESPPKEEPKVSHFRVRKPLRRVRAAERIPNVA